MAAAAQLAASFLPPSALGFEDEAAALELFRKTKSFFSAGGGQPGTGAAGLPGHPHPHHPFPGLYPPHPAAAAAAAAQQAGHQLPDVVSTLPGMFPPSHLNLKNPFSAAAAAGQPRLPFPLAEQMRMSLDFPHFRGFPGGPQLGGFVPGGNGGLSPRSGAQQQQQQQQASKQQQQQLQDSGSRSDEEAGGNNCQSKFWRLAIRFTWRHTFELIISHL